jgi:CheY-like chemotaxis protein
MAESKKENRLRPQHCILLIEDDPVDVMSVRRAFEQNKLTNPLYVVGNGEDGLAFLRHEGQFSSGNDSPRPTLILLDLKMPRMGGLEMLSILKGDPNLRHIPVVALTTSDDESDIQKSFREGVAGYLLKPVTFEKFAAAIKIFNLYWTLSELP